VVAGAAIAAAGVFASAAGDDASGDGSFASLHGLYWLTANLAADAPLLLAVDDLHWCDWASLRFLTYLARRLDGLPVLVVGGLRASEPGPDEALLAELRSDPSTLVLTPMPLSAGASVAIVRERLGEGVEAPFAEACFAATHGNPLLLGELVKALQVERVVPDAAHLDVVADLGPRAASRAVLLRLARLSADAMHFAPSLPVPGHGPHTGLRGEAVASAYRELVRAEIVRPEYPLGFVHPLVQAAVYHDLAPGERELSHEQAARLLLELHAPAEQVAAHVRAMPRSGEAW